MTEDEGVVRPRGSLGELVVVVVAEEDGNTPLSGDWAFRGTEVRKERRRKNIALGKEGMIFLQSEPVGAWAQAGTARSVVHCIEMNCGSLAVRKGRPVIRASGGRCRCWCRRRPR